MMTIGFVLIMMGIQLNLVESYELTPRFSNFFSETGEGPDVQAMAANNSPYQRASFSNPFTNSSGTGPQTSLKVIQHPRWLCWPVLFCGTVLVLQGFIKKE